eukprot:6327358-Amphidinium_carterae.1
MNITHSTNHALDVEVVECFCYSCSFTLAFSSTMWSLQVSCWKEDQLVLSYVSFSCIGVLQCHDNVVLVKELGGCKDPMSR